MADSIGELFVDVVARTGDFEQTLTSGVDDAMGDVRSSVQDAFSEVREVASDSLDDVGGAAQSAGSDVSEAMDEASSDAQESLDSIDGTGFTDRLMDNIGKVSLGFAGIGAASEGFARKQNETNRVLGRVSIATGIADDALSDLIEGLVDNTFSAADAAEAMERLVRSGIETEDEFEKILPVMDTFSDATGLDMVKSIDTFDKVLSALGIPMTEAEDHMDALGFIAARTEVDLNQLGALMRRESGTLREYGLSTDDIAAAMMALDAEGVKGPRAVMEFQRALAEGEGDIAAFEEALGLSAGQLDHQRERLADGAGMIDAFADSNNELRTPMEKLAVTIENQMFRFRGLSDIAGIAAAPIAAIGPAMMGVNATTQVLGKAMPMLGKALAGAGKAFLGLGKIILANPIFLIGALLIGVAALIWKFRDEIIDALVGAWEWIQEKVGALVDWFRTAIPEAIGAVVDWVKDNWPLILAIITGPIGLAVKFIVDNWDKIKETVANAVAAVRNTIRRVFDAIRDFIRTSINRVRDFVVDGFNTLRDRATNAVQSLRDSVRNALNSVVDFVRDLPGRVLRGLGNLGRLLFDKGRDMITGLLDGAKSLLKNIGKFFLDAVPSFIRKPFERALGISSPSKVFADLGRDTLEGYRRGLQDEFRDVERMLGAMGTDIPIAVRAEALSAPSLQNAGLSESVGRPGGSGTVVNVTVNNPTPEAASTSINREMRKLTFAGVFDE